MIAIVVAMACVALLDGLMLLSDPSLYRRCMEYVEEAMGAAWMVASAFAFLAPGLAFLIWAPFSTKPVVSAVVGGVCVVIGLFFALATMERFAYLADWWRCRSNRDYRIAGLVVIGLCVCMLLLAFELPRP